MNNKIKYVAGWFGLTDESIFVRKNSHPSSGLSDYLTALVQELNELQLKRRIEIHFNVQISMSNRPKYLFLLEHPNIRPQNFLFSERKYEKIFSWNLDLSNLDNFVYTAYPHDLKMGRYKERRQFRYSMISSNRNLFIDKSGLSLYDKRQEVIRYSEDKKIDFHLFGLGWDKKFVQAGIYPFVLSKIPNKMIPKTREGLKCYHGTVNSKSAVLQNSVFNFCFENIRRYPGYVSEKIWDSLAAGAIPVYWPAWSIPESYLPSDCYIDASDFDNVDDLYKYLNSIPNTDLLEWQKYCFEVANTYGKNISIKNYVSNVLKSFEN